MQGDLALLHAGKDDRLSDLPEGVLEHVLSFLPAADAVRSSVLSRRWRGAWTRAPALNLSDEQHRVRFVAFARAVLSRYGSPDIPALNVVLSRESSLGTDKTAWLRVAMERVVGSVSVSVTARPLDRLMILPRRMRAKKVSLTLSGGVEHGPLVLPEPGGGGPASYGALTELSLSSVRLQEHRRPLGEFLSSCCSRLRKLRLRSVSGGCRLVLHMDLLEELEMEDVDALSELQVVSPSLRVLDVTSCFYSWRPDAVVEISAPRLEILTWHGNLPKHLSFVTGSRCIRRLAGLCFYLPWKEFRSSSAVRLLQTCSGANELSVRVDIPDHTSPSWLSPEYLGHVPELPNIRVLSLQVVAVRRFISCPVASVILSFIRQCPNLRWLHIDLSMMHRFSRFHPDCLMVPDENETEAAEPSESDPLEAQRDELQLDSLEKIRLSGFMGTHQEMEVADLLFGGAGAAARTSLDRISISLFPRLVRQGADGGAEETLRPFVWMSAPFAHLRRHLDGVGARVEARFPLAGGRWETNPGEGLAWTRN